MVLGGCGCGLMCMGQVKSSPFRGGRGSEGGLGWKGPGDVGRGGMG